jgi:DNA gyrase subunit A
VQDESDRNGVRVVIELKRDATAEVVLNQLYRFTPMQTYFGCNMLALNGGRPEQLTLLRFLSSFIAFREEVVARRTEIVDWAGDMDDEDLIEREDMVVTITSGGYIKRTPLADFRAQKRGGKGLSGMQTKEEDVVTTLFVANTHDQLLFFTTDGMVYKLKTWRLPLGGRTSKGKAIVNILPIPPGVSIAAIMPVDRPDSEWDDLQIVFATSDGDVRRNALSDFTNVMRNGKIAMKLPEGVELVNARICSPDDDVMLVTDSGRAIRFPTTDVRVFKGRDSTGVRGIRLSGEDRVVSMSVIRHFEASSDERAAYLKMRRLVAGVTEETETDEEEGNADAGISQERYAEMSAAENLILTITAGARTRRHGRHGHGQGDARRRPRRLLPGRDG